MARLLLLHGFTGAPSSWHPVEQRLPRGFDIVAPYLTGHGRPAAALDTHSFEAELDRIERLLPPGSWQVAGYSLGARLALGLLVRHASRFERAILISGRPGLETAPEREARIAADEALARRLELEGLAAFVEHWQALPMFATQTRLSSALRDAEHARRMSHEAVGLAHSLRVTGLGRMPSYWGELGQLSTPIEVLVGALDPSFCALGEAVVGKLPHARLTRVADAGHNLPLEQPGEVARVITRGSSK